VLATVKGKVPRTTPVDFFNDGLTIWIAGEPGLKISNIRSNSRVAVGVYHPMDHSKHNRSLQVQGKATLINLKNHRRKFLNRVKKLGLYASLEKILGERIEEWGYVKESKHELVEKMLMRFNLIRIDPDEIIYLSIHPVTGAEKNIWKKNTRSGRRP
jgi:nitroimidazol reductase NimA-like FMN-containing flavoprotein (pyridoxamine 5'-phosphate oxidase superfamily)